jgi:hypothetical protein
VARRDPRYRPYRAILWAIYFGCVLLGVGLVIVSVARELHGGGGAHTGPAPSGDALRGCLADLEALFREQHDRAWSLTAALDRVQPLDEWREWGHSWEGRLDELSGRCGLDAPGDDARREMAAARDGMRELHRAYEAHVQRFAVEQKDLLRGVARAFAGARAALGDPR